MTQKTMLLTGATGILGGWVLAEALKRDYRPVVLMRDATAEGARERLCEVMALADAPAGPEAVEVVRGDVRKPFLGLSGHDVAELRRRCDVFIHSAASVSFDPQQGDHTWDTNVGGLTHALQVAEDSGMRFYHVSTAYVAGTRTDHVHESDLEAGQNFHNAYERSKYECEQMVREAFASGRVQGGVFRPAIIIGAASNGRIASFYNFYGFLRLIDTVISGKLDCEGAVVRLPVKPECTKNLVPVDWCAQAMWEAIANDAGDGTTYHITHPQPVSQGQMIAWANVMLEPYHLRVETVDALEENSESPLEQLTAFWLRHYASYLHDEPTFDRTNIERAAPKSPVPPIDFELLQKLYAYARSEHWQGLLSSKRQERLKQSAHAAMPEPVVAAEIAGKTVF